MSLSQTEKGIALAAVSGAGFGLMPLLAKVAYAGGANVTQVLTLRFLLAAALLWASLSGGTVLTPPPSPGRQPKRNLTVPRRELFSLFLLGALGYGVMSSLYFKGLSLLPASLSALFLYTYPALVAGLSHLVGEERLSWKRGLAVLASFLGLALMLGGSWSGANAVGTFFGLTAAFTYALYILAGNSILKRVEPQVASTYAITSGALVYLIYSLFTGQLSFHLPLATWIALLTMALISTGLAIATFFQAVKLIGAPLASIVSTVEPLVTILLSILFLGERLSLLQGTGGLFILGSILWLQWPARKGSVFQA
ncbi:MAG: DMT family transporter [Firmicutes bacterium]|nr:DMT family transporter [Bacillota bacterium]